MSSTPRSTKDELIAQDIKRLHAMGYAQELFRAMGGFSNFAISFTIISILSGCVTLFYLTTINGGFTAASLGWPSWLPPIPLPVASITGPPNLAALPGAGSPAGSTLLARLPLPPVSIMAPLSPSILCCMPGFRQFPPCRALAIRRRNGSPY